MKENETPESIKYQKFLASVKENNSVWLLKAYDGLYAMLEDNAGLEYIPVWDNEADAKKYADEDWDRYIPDQLSIKEFIGWLKELEKDNIIIAVSPGDDKKTIPIKPGQLLDHL